MTTSAQAGIENATNRPVRPDLFSTPATRGGSDQARISILAALNPVQPTPRKTGKPSRRLLLASLFCMGGLALAILLPDQVFSPTGPEHWDTPAATPVPTPPVHAAPVAEAPAPAPPPAPASIETLPEQAIATSIQAPASSTSMPQQSAADAQPSAAQEASAIQISGAPADAKQTTHSSILNALAEPSSKAKAKARNTPQQTKNKRQRQTQATSVDTDVLLLEALVSARPNRAIPSASPGEIK